MELANTASIVTGGGLGLGAATARFLATGGSHVFALDLAESLAVAPAIDGVTYVEADVCSPEQVQGAVRQAAASGRPLRFVINCAGIAPVESVLTAGRHHSLDLFRKVIEVNLIGTFNVMAIASEAIATTEAVEGGSRGVIVNTASIGAIDGMAGTSAYAASKGGVISLGVPSARDLALYGIRVMTIAPGTFLTRLTHGEEVQAYLASKVPFPNRLGRPEEFADLVGDVIRSDYLNGAVIRLDGCVRMAP